MSQKYYTFLNLFAEWWQQAIVGFKSQPKCEGRQVAPGPSLACTLFGSRGPWAAAAYQRTRVKQLQTTSFYEIRHAVGLEKLRILVYIHSRTYWY